MSTLQPSVEATLHEDGTASLTIEGHHRHLDTDTAETARSKTLDIVIEHAQTTGATVRALMHDTTGRWPLLVHPNGTVEPDTQNIAPAQDPPTATPQAKRRQAAPAPAKPHAAEAPARSAAATTGKAPKPTRTGKNPFLPDSPEAPNKPEAPAELPGPREARSSFLVTETVEKPATRGLRGVLTRAGIRVSPCDAERAERADAQAVSQHWPGQRTIAIVNGKGGAGKTPTTVLLSAIFARYGGAGVLAWDNNQTRGTLGWRTEQGPHEATLLELLPEANRLLSTSAQSADLAHFVHHQTRDKYDVLRSKPMALAHEQRIEPADVDAIHSVAAKYYRLIFIDSGNDESDPMWLRMIDHADQLVVATSTRNDHAEAGALLLEGLAERNEHSARLAREAVAVVSQADPKATRTDMESVAKGYEALVRQAVQVPHDPALVDGQIFYESLRPATQRAWLAAAAAVAGGLSRNRALGRIRTEIHA